MATPSLVLDRPATPNPARSGLRPRSAQGAGSGVATIEPPTSARTGVRPLPGSSGPPGTGGPGTSREVIAASAVGVDLRASGPARCTASPNQAMSS